MSPARTDDDAALEALLRRDSLEPAARLALFQEMARHFQDQVPFPPATVEGLTDEAYVRSVVDLLLRPEREATLPPPSSGVPRPNAHDPSPSP